MLRKIQNWIEWLRTPKQAPATPNVAELLDRLERIELQNRVLFGTLANMLPNQNHHTETATPQKQIGFIVNASK